MKKTLLFLVVVLVGCATSPPATEEDMKRTYEVPYDTLYGAVQMTLLEMEFDIVNAAPTMLKAEKQLIGTGGVSLMVGKDSAIVWYCSVYLSSKKPPIPVLIKQYVSYSDGSHRSDSDKAAYDHFWALLESKLP